MNQHLQCARGWYYPLLGGALGALLSCGVWAVEPADLVQQANEALRAAQSSGFTGKADLSREQLGQAAEAIRVLGEQDPANRQLKSLEQRYQRQLKELDRRSGHQAASAERPAVAAPEGSPVAAGGARQAPLPRDLSQRMKPVQQAVRAVGFHLRNLEDAKLGRASRTPEQVMEAMEAALREAQDACSEFASASHQQGFGEHPEVQRIRRECEDTVAQVGKARQSGAAFVKEQAAVAGALADDLASLNREVERLDGILGKATGAAIHYNALKPAEDLLGAIEQFERDDLEATRRLVSGISERYGSTADAVVARTGSRELWYPLERLMKLLDDVPRTRTAMANDLAKRTQEMIAGLPQMHDFERLKAHAMVQDWAQLANRFDPESPAVKALMASLGAALANDQRQLELKIDQAQWPGQAPNAPKDAAHLARVAWDWLANDPGWGKRPTEPEAPIALVVTGPWSVQARNLVGEPVMYGLPVLVAVQRPDDREKGVARVFALTMRTQEQAGVREAPPFASVTVGDSLFIRAKAVK